MGLLEVVVPNSNPNPTPILHQLVREPPFQEEGWLEAGGRCQAGDGFLGRVPNSLGGMAEGCRTLNRPPPIIMECRVGISTTGVGHRATTTFVGGAEDRRLYEGWLSARVWV